MRNLVKILAMGTALAATPAMAQLVGGSAGAQAGLGVGVDAGPVVDSANRTVGSTVGTVGRTIDRTVGTVDSRVNRTLDTTNLALATRSDVRTGVMVRDGNNRRVGTVQRIDGNSAVVVRGNRAYNVPLAALYKSGKRLVTSIPRPDLAPTASVNAQANANANASANR